METEYHYVEDSKYTIVFVHGILGSPYRFKDLFPLVPNDFSYVKVVLDGHGKKAKDFSKTSLKKWENQISSLLSELKEKNQKVIYVGHSMGCLLGMMESLKKDTNIDVLFMLNVPLRAKLGFMTIKQCLKCAFGNPKNFDAMTHNFIDNCSIEISHNPFVYIGWVPRFFDLFKLMKKTRGKIQDVTTRCICFHSGRDELVRQKALKDLKRNPYFEIHVQEKSGHYYLLDKDTKEMQDCFSDILKKAADSSL